MHTIIMMGRGGGYFLFARVSVVRFVAQRRIAALTTANVADVIWLPLSLFFFTLAGPNRATAVRVLHRFATKKYPDKRKKNKLNKKLLVSGARTLRGLAVNTAERALACNYCATEARILRLI